MGSEVVRHATGREALARLRGGHSPTITGALAPSRRDVRSRWLWQVVSGRRDQAIAKSSVAGSSGRSVRGGRDTVLIANLVAVGVCP